jgi:parallel beta-helix repeat protein
VATYYIDYNRGSDSNAGTSSSAPWQNLSKIAATTGATAGDSFLLADDSSWVLTPSTRVVPPTTWSGSQSSPVVIGKYSPSSQSAEQRPLITLNVETSPSDWTYDALLNGWKYTYPTAHMNNAALVRLADTWLASATGNNSDGAIESVDGRYVARLDNQTLVLYAPAGTDPVSYYGKVVVSAQATGAITLSSGRKWVTVQDIAFRETGCGVLCYSADALAAGYVVERCRMDIGCLAGVGGASPGNVRAWIRDSEVYDFGAIGIHVNSTGGAGIAYAELYRNVISHGGHQWSQGGIYLQARNSAGDAIVSVHHNEVSHCEWGTRDKALDGCGIYAETGSNNTHIFANVVHDCYVALQDNSGRRVQWSGNLIYNCRRGIRVTDESNNGASDCRLYNNTFLIGDTNQQASEFGNTTQGADYPAVWSLSGDDPINITAQNNIFANIGGQRGRAVFGLPDTYGASSYSLSGNWVYGFEADSLKASDNSVPSPAPTITNAGTTDPTQYLTESHALRSEGYTLVSPNPLSTVGTYFAGAKLMNGRARPGWTPVGAYMGVVPRATATSRTTATTRATATSRAERNDLTP